MKTAEIIQFPLFSGANDVTRTHDLLITNQLLYRLSYISIFTFGVADLLITNQLLYRLSYTSMSLRTVAIISYFSLTVNTIFSIVPYSIRRLCILRFVFCKISFIFISLFCHLYKNFASFLQK